MGDHKKMNVKLGKKEKDYYTSSPLEDILWHIPVCIPSKMMVL
jgi:hypothetical protein